MNGIHPVWNGYVILLNIHSILTLRAGVACLLYFDLDYFGLLGKASSQLFYSSC